MEKQTTSEQDSQTIEWSLKLESFDCSFCNVTVCVLLPEQFKAVMSNLLHLLATAHHRIHMSTRCEQWTNEQVIFFPSQTDLFQIKSRPVEVKLSSNRHKKQGLEQILILYIFYFIIIYVSNERRWKKIKDYWKYKVRIYLESKTVVGKWHFHMWQLLLNGHMHTIFLYYFEGVNICCRWKTCLGTTIRRWVSVGMSHIQYRHLPSQMFH